MQTLLDKFKLGSEKEDLQVVIDHISKGVVFRGTNLWILILAIFVASLGLNINSTAVIIGAMLISPLMGPIMGIGLGIGINDLKLVRLSFSNLLVAFVVSLAASTLFFLISPLNDAHSEILSRTSPTIYDLLIAFFGGLSGIIAVCTKNKGNVIPGVAIATALMPPLCTAGYGLATLQFSFFFGALYLFIINTVFIALSTFIIVQVLHFPKKSFKETKAEILARRTVWFISVLTLIPSIYFGYDMIQKNNFIKRANKFIATEARFPNDYLLDQQIDVDNKKITIVFGGKQILPEEIEKLKSLMKFYGLEKFMLNVHQGFSSAGDVNVSAEREKLNAMDAIIQAQQHQNDSLQQYLTSIKHTIFLSSVMQQEIKVIYPAIHYIFIDQSNVLNHDDNDKELTIYIVLRKSLQSKSDYQKVKAWVRERVKPTPVTINFVQ